MSKLLLVEDDEALAMGIEFTLKDEGYETLRTSTVAEAGVIEVSSKIGIGTRFNITFLKY